MKNEAIGKILEKHSIPYYIESGKIYADSLIVGTGKFEQIEDLTGYSRKELYDWLGY